MSAQINLLIEEEKGPALSAVRALLFLLALAVVLLVYWDKVRTENTALRQTLKLNQQLLAAEKSGLEQIKQRNAARQQSPELEALKKRAAESKQLLDAVKKAQLGSAEGYSGHLIALARNVDDGVWLTGVSIGDGGKTVRIEGRSLSTDLVLRYADRLNTQLADYGAHLDSVEMKPLEGSVPPVVAFSLY